MPVPSDELAFALSVNLDDLRPWEFWEADSAELYMLRSLKAAYYEGRQDAREQMEKPEAT